MIPGVPGQLPGHGVLTLSNRQPDCRVHTAGLRACVRYHLEAELGLASYALGIHLLTARQMARANEQHLRHSGPTDVITFDYAAPGEGVLHGELLVCPAVAIEQARAYRTSWESELVRYIIHGVLHLRGFDDRTAAARRLMKREEDRLLRALVRTHSLRRLRSPVRTTRKRLLE